MKRILIILLVLILSLGLLVTGCSSKTESESSGQNPQSVAAPDFQLPNLDEQSVSLSDFRGRPVLINFWASWCQPCRIEMPFLQEIFEDEEWSDKGLVILAINVGEKPAIVKSFMEHYGLTFTALLDIDGSVAGRYGARAYPTTFLIDKDGIMIAVKYGPFLSKAEIEEGLNKFLP